jgi:uncharacterized membrane protein
MRMQGKKQMERTTTVNAPVEAVYTLFMDNGELAHWAPAVDAVIDQHDGDESGVDATRTCAVTISGRSGTMVERCVRAEPNRCASFLVVDDSFGFRRTLIDYGFTAHFAPANGRATTVRIETFYTPANPIVAVLNALIMRRRFRNVVDDLLGGLRTVAEQRHTGPGERG